MTTHDHSAAAELSFEQDAITTAAQAHAFCERFESVLHTLVDVIEEETSLLRRGELKSLNTITPRKTQAVNTYMHGLELAKRNAVALGNLAPDAVVKMREQHGAIRPILQQNLSVVATARSVSDKVVETVARAVGSTVQTRTYGANGMNSYPQRSARGIAINTTL